MSNSMPRSVNFKKVLSMTLILALPKRIIIMPFELVKFYLRHPVSEEAFLKTTQSVNAMNTKQQKVQLNFFERMH